MSPPTRDARPMPLGASSSRLADRLGSTLFVAALAHGVIILGITFTAGPLAESEALPSLNVTLVVDRRELDRPEDSQLLADANQQGGGRAPEGVRPTTALAADQPLTQAGDPGAADAVDGRPREEAPPAEQLVTRSPNDARINAVPNATDTPTAAPQSAAALLDLSAPQSLAMEIDVRAEMPDSDDRDMLAAATTRESALAAYLDGWRRRVERIGTVNFPARFRGDHGFGRPTLEVAIAADGDLADIVVRRSSGNSALDQAAVSILRLAAPFDPLPDSIRADYEVLRFAYEWEFSDGADDGSPAPSP
jgi:periplasmic protein TonB